MLAKGYFIFLSITKRTIFSTYNRIERKNLILELEDLIMLVVTARLFKDNQLVGYRLSDGQQEQNLSVLQAWMYAKNKQVQNVVAIGNQSDPGLSGTNGFELRKLPEINNKKYAKIANIVFDDQTLAAAIIRQSVNNGLIQYNGKDEYRTKASKLVREDINASILTHFNQKAFSNSIMVENTLCDGNDPGGVIILVPRKGLQPASKIIGYKIKNIGTHPIPYTRMTITEEHSTSESVLNVGESAYINNAEMALLASKPEIGCTFANGEMYILGHLKPKTVYGFLSNAVVFRFTDNKGTHDKGIKLDARDIDDKEVLKKYFCLSPIFNVEDTFDTKTSAQLRGTDVDKAGKKKKWATRNVQTLILNSKYNSSVHSQKSDTPGYFYA